MADVTITITGVDKVLQKLGKIEGPKVLLMPMEASVIELETFMKWYPPEIDSIQGPAMIPILSFRTKGGKLVRMRANKVSGKNIAWGKAASLNYKRTGKLGQRWGNKVKLTSDGVEGTVTNNLSYAPYVQSDKLQARIHQGRWRTDVQAIEQLRGAIVRRFEAAIEAALR